MPETNSSLFSKFLPGNQVTRDNLELGRHIGQGCNAAVYEARLVHHTADSDIESEVDNDVPATADVEDDISDTESDITVLSASTDEQEAPDMFLVEDEDAVIVDVDYPSDTDSDISYLDISPDDVDYPSDTDSDISYLDVSPDDVDWVDNDLLTLDTMSDNSLQTTETSPSDSQDESMYMSLDSGSSTDSEFQLAVKMMFNYGVDSNADAILSAMACEAVPAMMAQSQQQMTMWQNGHKVRKKALPSHPNIVEMWGMFVDSVPSLGDSLYNYPAALPARLHSEGVGRNKTLFLVMNKYNSTLKDYISSVVSLGFRERLYLLAQLLEGVAHMSHHEIAHRDMKSDNILLDTNIEGPPRLVISDFGCCLADSRNGLRIPYQTDQIDRGGNTALMAPEIATAEPSLFSYLDYRKADLWGAGAMAFEILGEDNPFYTTPNKGRLDSRTYKRDELPPLPSDVPDVLRKLVYNLLERNPSKRVSQRLAADILQVLLWAPSDWLLPGNKVSRSEVMWWVITMATHVHFDFQGQKSRSSMEPSSRSPEFDLLSMSRPSESEKGCGSSTAIHLKKCFLRGFNFNRLHQAFNFCGVEIVR